MAHQQPPLPTSRMWGGVAEPRRVFGDRLYDHSTLPPSEFEERRARPRADDRAAALERGQHAGAGGFHGGGTVAIAAEMGEKDVPPARRSDREEQFPGAVVGKMAVPAADALFDGPGSLPVVLQHLRAEVGLDDEDVRLPDALPNMLRSMAQVG